MQSIQKVLDWVLLSSSNSERVSLTVKGALLGAVPAIMYVVGVAHLNLGADTLTNIFDGVAAFIQAALTVIAVGATLYGAIRKAWITMFKPASSSSQ